MLAPPYWMRKDEHVYVIHIARVADTVWPERSNELTIFTELKRFWSGFEGETNTAVHRRVLDRPFLAAAGRIHTEIEHNARTSRRTTPTAAPATTQVRKDSGRSRGEGSATSLDPKTLPRVCGNRNHNQHQEDCDRTHQPLSEPHRVLRNAPQRGERESRTRLDGPRNAPCGDGTPEGGTRIKGHGLRSRGLERILPLTSSSVENQAAPSKG